MKRSLTKEKVLLNAEAAEVRRERKGRDCLITNYSIWGVKLDIDPLLATARPTAKHEVWRRGDPTGLGTPAVSAGLIIEVFCGTSAAALRTL
jgi:hypothetical protein